MIFFMYGAEYEAAMEIDSPLPLTAGLISDPQEDFNPGKQRLLVQISSH
jgi:hypothetical protein